MKIDKKCLIEAVINELKRQESEIENSLKATRKAAIEAPGAMQSKSDTTKFQMNILSDTLRATISEKKNAISILSAFPESQLKLLNSVQIGAIVELQKNKENFYFYFVLPEGGGVEVKYDTKRITIITPKTPIARSLIGKNEGDLVEFKTPTGIIQEIKIISIQ
ncbi:MAG: GreA/GreB family elongation factor [Patescibacteria group bacterium]